MKQETLDLAAIRTRLTQARGKEYWRSLEELAGTEAFQELLQQEFPRQASVWSNEVGRREFLKLMGASLALAGLSACGSPAPTDEKIVPYVRQPEETMLGKPMFFATAFTLLGGVASGLLVESHEGRPTKIEGNPNHPASLGSTDAMAQASILTLYDPDRSQAVNNAECLSHRAQRRARGRAAQRRRRTPHSDRNRHFSHPGDPVGTVPRQVSQSKVASV